MLTTPIDKILPKMPNLPQIFMPTMLTSPQKSKSCHNHINIAILINIVENIIGVKQNKYKNNVADYNT
jgi:hypothetical protein